MSVERSVMRGMIVLVLSLLALPGCSFHFTGSLFRSEAKPARNAAMGNEALAARLLCGGFRPEDVQRVLGLNGTDADDALKIVAVAQAGLKCSTPAPSPSPQGGPQ